MEESGSVTGHPTGVSHLTGKQDSLEKKGREKSQSDPNRSFQIYGKPENGGVIAL